MLLLFCFVASGTVTNLFPTIVKTLGYNNIHSLLLTVPPYVLGVITTFLNSWHADKTGERYFHITLPLYFAVVAFIIAAATIKTAPRYLAMMLMIPGVYTGYVVALAWISNTLPRPPAKVPSFFSLPFPQFSSHLRDRVYSQSCRAYIPIPSLACRRPRSHQRRLQRLLYLRIIHVSRKRRTSLWYVPPSFPFSFPHPLFGPRSSSLPPFPPTHHPTQKSNPIQLTRQTPRKTVVAMSVNCVTAFIAIVAATVLRFILLHLNKKLDRGEVVEGAVAVGEAVPGEAARKGFRFVL